MALLLFYHFQLLFHLTFNLLCSLVLCYCLLLYLLGALAVGRLGDEDKEDEWLDVFLELRVYGLI